MEPNTQDINPLIHVIVKLLSWEVLQFFTYSRHRMVTKKENDNFRRILRLKPPRYDKYEMSTVCLSNFRVFRHSLRGALYMIRNSINLVTFDLTHCLEVKKLSIHSYYINRFKSKTWGFFFSSTCLVGD